MTSLGTWAGCLLSCHGSDSLSKEVSSGAHCSLEDTCWSQALGPSFIHSDTRAQGQSHGADSRTQACPWGTPGLPCWTELDGVGFCLLLAVRLWSCSLIPLNPFLPLLNRLKNSPV